ncbi:hypothetical protein HanRHA438_Chr13g0598551 [Helianthus annuus]|nr:hypothetical protein HanRHA438_Chr13g0598551 [Helianthus annuus]
MLPTVNRQPKITYLLRASIKSTSWIAISPIYHHCSFSPTRTIHNGEIGFSLSELGLQFLLKGKYVLGLGLIQRKGMK